MDIFFKLDACKKSTKYLEPLLKLIEKGNIRNPGFVLEDLLEIFPCPKHRGPRLDDLDFEGLLEYHDHLSNALRNRFFWEQKIERRLVADDSLKTLRYIEKSKRAGSLSFEILR
jgi:hypothetical protein